MNLLLPFVSITVSNPKSIKVNKKPPIDLNELLISLLEFTGVSIEKGSIRVVSYSNAHIVVSQV